MTFTISAGWAIIEIGTTYGVRSAEYLFFGSVINLSGPICLAISGPIADKFGIQIWFILAAVLVFASIAYGFCNKQLMSLEIV